MTAFHRRAARVLPSAAAALSFIAAFSLAGTAAFAQHAADVLPPRAAAYPEAVEQARELARDLVESENLPGLSAAVGIDGGVVWAEGFGWADLEQRVPVTPLTKFRIGSVSKPLTSVAVGLLYERGRLDLDAPVQQYVPDFPEKRWPITTRELMGHVAGIRHYRGDEFLSSKHYDGVLEGLAIFADDELLFEPGTGYSYSSYGWNLVSAVVQRAAGEEFLGFMQHEVFAPFGMRHTVPGYMARIVPQRVEFYVQGEDGELRNAPWVDNSYKWAGGGFLSTPTDLVRFGLGMLNGGVLEPETVELLWTSLRLNSGEATGYGLGWAVGEDDQGRRFAAHGGGSVGGTTWFVIYPDLKFVIAVTTNLSDADGTGDLAEALAAAFGPASSATAGAAN
ncbi:MAG TPA: serine hydrolase domain-containing protein [Woeseiaceae bacterium]|nr:serine hydrolase domain-containing protein [Woeseiaceae bacterium]